MPRIETMNFDDFFQAATGIPSGPFEYQCHLGCGDQKAGEDRAVWLSRGSKCESRLINIPTGLGKTAAVVLAWLYNRVALNRSDWPRRLVYCLPMRTLVEQTEKEVRKWLVRLARKHTKPRDGSDLRWLALHSPVILMGGEDAGEWDIYPEKPAILIGTQDMLLSRALNRGYGMSRYRWPMHFGLLNNDCLWVMDETQLMGVGVESSAQLDGFRTDGRMPTAGGCLTWWMSATLDKSRLVTVDHRKLGPVVELSVEEKAAGRPKALFTAPKKLSRASLELTPANKKEYAKQLASLIKERHQPGTLTLVVLNRVQRAREVFEILTTRKKPLYDKPENVALIHSRFRPVDRERHTKILFRSGDRIVVATQAVEAGVDVSARQLITELAPWSSLVQRVGRCNRRADIPDAEVLWVDIKPKDDKDDLLLPYQADELGKARTALTEPTPLNDASPLALSERGKTVEPEKTIRPVIRRRDLVDLFDTTPDVCGQDLDISRYIRDGEDNDVQFFWREIAADAAPDDDEPQPQRNELCRVSIRDARDFWKKKTTRTWRWNPLEKAWERAAAPRPGGVYLMAASSGGYSDTIGWTGEPKVEQLTVHRPAKADGEGHDSEPGTFRRRWQSIPEHTALVVKETDALAARLAQDFQPLFHAAALWHDVGKAHEAFQKMLRGDDPARAAQLWAKSTNAGDRCERRFFRHELASALAWLLVGPQEVSEPDLVAYLIAAHHGKVRLSIRSLPDEKGDPQNPERLFARGIWDGDPLPSVPLGEITTPPVTLDLSFMQMGEGPHGASWLARAVALRDRLGPFRLAYLETLLRAADARASRETQTPAQPGGISGVSSGMELREQSPPYLATQALSPAEQSLVADLVADGLSIQDKFRPEPLYKLTGKGHYASQSVEEIRKAKHEKGGQP